MSKEFFDAEAQQHAADLDIVRELRHSDASLYQLAHGRGARWQFNQLKSQLEERDAMIAELESSLRLLTLKAQSESEIQSLKQQLESAVFHLKDADLRTRGNRAFDHLNNRIYFFLQKLKGGE